MASGTVMMPTSRPIPIVIRNLCSSRSDRDVLDRKVGVQKLLPVWEANGEYGIDMTFIMKPGARLEPGSGSPHS